MTTGTELNNYEVKKYYYNKDKPNDKNLCNFQKSATLIFFDIKIKSFWLNMKSSWCQLFFFNISWTSNNTTNSGHKGRHFVQRY